MAPNPGLPRTLKTVTVPQSRPATPHLLAGLCQLKASLSMAAPQPSPTSPPRFSSAKSDSRSSLGHWFLESQPSGAVGTAQQDLLQLTHVSGSAEVTVPPRLAYEALVISLIKRLHQQPKIPWK